MLGAGLVAAPRGLRRVARSLERAPSAVLPARLHAAGDTLTLGNDAIAGAWRVRAGRLEALHVTDRASGTVLALPPDAFTLRLAGGETLGASAMRVVDGPHERAIDAHPRAARAAARVPGRAIEILLRDDAARLEVAWRAVLRDGSRYLRQEVTLRPLGGPVPIREIGLVDVAAPGAAVHGTVAGSPAVALPFYLAFEHPLSASAVDGGRVRCTLSRALPLRPGTTFRASSVIGVARPGQLRRDVLGYVERERAHPYRTFLHYNSWYDIGYFNKYTEADALGAIAAFGIELVQRRNVTLSSFLFDDGWDDPRTLWGFGPGFPDGFTRVRAAAARWGAAPGVWLSPWGGYGQPKQDRLAYGRAQGFETNAGGFALSGPTYYRRFHDTCVRFIEQYGVNQFKFDGTGNAASAFPGSIFDSDFDAAITLIGDLRTLEPDLYVNLTTGTYPSPFWLRYADSIWRGGEDHDFAGVGSPRQRWITYRDADTRANVVGRGPLYPLNALMLHGLIYARRARQLDGDPQGDFRSEVRSYFGTGTQLQEMYITAALLSHDDWDDIAECARWSRRRAGTLVDTHWVGGDPAHLEPYGWASWSREGAILVLRNPAARAQSITLDPAAALELPPDAEGRFTARSPWRADRARPSLPLDAGRPHEFPLAPFEVLTLEMASS